MAMTASDDTSMPSMTYMSLMQLVAIKVLSWKKRENLLKGPSINEL